MSDYSRRSTCRRKVWLPWRLRFIFVGFTSENVNRSKKEKLHGAPWFSRTDQTGDGRSSRWSRPMEFKPDFYSHGRFSSDEDASRGSPALIHCTHAGDFRLFADRRPWAASQSLPPGALPFNIRDFITGPFFRLIENPGQDLFRPPGLTFRRVSIGRARVSVFD